MRNGLDLRRKLLKRSIAAPTAGFCSRLSWALAGTEPALLNVAPGLIGYGVAGTRFVNQFRSRYPELARRANTLTIIFPDDEAVAVEIENMKVAKSVDRLLFIVGLGEISGAHAVAAIRSLIKDRLLPIALSPHAGSPDSVQAGCLAIPPCDSTGSMHALALAQQSDLLAIPDLPINFFNPGELYFHVGDLTYTKDKREFLDRFVPEWIATVLSCEDWATA